MIWARMLAYITGTVDRELLLRNEYLAAENRILRVQIKGRSLLDKLEGNIGGARTLVECRGRMGWPERGVYFFRERGENRSDTGEGPRIVRVGTHALKTGAGTKLWGRLSQHKGQRRTGGGNHRASIFRLLVGTALINRYGHDFPTWGEPITAGRDVRAAELQLEGAVSQIIGDMPFLWLAIEDDAGPDSMRGRIERNSISLLSNFNKPLLDLPSRSWLGNYCDRERVKAAGLWNSKWLCFLTACPAKIGAFSSAAVICRISPPTGRSGEVER